MRILAALWRRIRALAGVQDPALVHARRRLTEVRAALAKERSSGQDERRRWHAQRDQWHHDRQDLKRRALNSDIVRALLPARTRTLGARAIEAAAAHYDTLLQDASPAYRAAVISVTQPAPDLVTTDVQGLAWSVPVPATVTGAARDRFIAKQRFPYRAITQTREFSVGPVMLDIGANIGRMSIPRVILGDFGRAYCAEPDPLNFAALVRNVAANGLRGLVLPDQVAIGSVTGPVRLRRAKYPGGHSVSTDTSPTPNTIEVPCWTLDAWCEHLRIDPALVTYIKVDTQGWELHVFRGATAFLEHPHIAWQIEIQPSLRESGEPDLALYAFCAEHFTHFVDLDKVATGPRARPTTEIGDALSYLINRKRPTDIILFNAGATLDETPGQQAILSRLD